MDTQPKPASKRGGRREGAGRPRVYEGGLIRTVVYLTPEQVGAMVRIGDGNISAAVRQVIDESGYV